MDLGKNTKFDVFTVTSMNMGGVDWIQLARDWDQSQAVVSAVLNLQVLATCS
jgi:hypothetical protein